MTMTYETFPRRTGHTNTNIRAATKKQSTTISDFGTPFDSSTHLLGLASHQRASRRCPPCSRPSPTVPAPDERRPTDKAASALGSGRCVARWRGSCVSGARVGRFPTQASDDLSSLRGVREGSRLDGKIPVEWVGVSVVIVACASLLLLSRAVATWYAKAKRFDGMGALAWKVFEMQRYLNKTIELDLLQ